MLKDCLQVFKKLYEEKGQALITDNYILSEGTYILVDDNGNIENVVDVSRKNFDRIECSDFIIIDYLSKLIDMNKPIDGKKVIHSNNYLSFWVKKESLTLDSKGERKLTNDIIEDYYKILSDPKIKYKKGKALTLYEDIESQIGEPTREQILKCEIWIKNNIFSILENLKIKEDKSYLKIFFKADVEKYERENKRYIVPNIYNSTDYNVVKDNIIYGLPNDNMGLNSKKPYLENKTRVNSIPYLISTEEVNLQKKFIDYLYNEACNRKTNIYINEENINACESNEAPEEEFKGYFLRIKKGKELEVHEFDTIADYNPKIIDLNINQVIPVKDFLNSNIEYKLQYGSVILLKDLKSIINTVFFSGMLLSHYFTEEKDIRVRDEKLKKEILEYRDGFFQWFHKGNSSIIKAQFKTNSLDIIKNSLKYNDNKLRIIEKFNLRSAILNYLEGREEMGDKLRAIHDSLRGKINEDNTSIISNDDEYYFAVGQLVSYLISLNKTSKKTHSLINPILNCKSDDKLKKEVCRMFKKYSYNINQNNRRFNNLNAMIIGYEPENKNVDEETVIAGYLYSNLIYEKKESN